MEHMKEKTYNKRYIVKIVGIVQGVGFRPFIYTKAIFYSINGWVVNAGGAVIIDCSGTGENIKNFILDIVKHPPSLAKLEKIECTLVKLGYETNTNSDAFNILESMDDKNQVRFVSADVATCAKCLEDIQREGTSRYRYAFTNCTECGPRYTIIRALPYDRPYTTMNSFQMCENCKEEYYNPNNRRFHAEPNCCEKCGPRLSLLNNKGQIISCEDVIQEAIRLIQKGKIFAIKGIGGFHFVCDSRNQETIQDLRIKKHRKEKPLALLAKNMEVIKEICDVSEKEEEILLSNKRPIVLLNKKLSFPSEGIAPKLKKIGVMLPYTPLQVLLIKDGLDLLVMTSGNMSGMPIEYTNEGAINNLRDVADYFLTYDRDIYIPIDDSVVKVVNGKEFVSRRARGYSPYAVKSEGDLTIIGVGAEQKNSICVSKSEYTNLSQYLGNLEEYNCYKNFQFVLRHFINIFDIKADIFAHDMHPNYISTHFAKSQKVKKIAVCHHHAHMVSCMAEHSIREMVIGIVFDGTGYGLDGAVWGGEFLVGNRDSFRRVGQLEYIQIQGGELAIKEPWRSALSYLHAIDYDQIEIIEGVELGDMKAVQKALELGVNCFLSSSIGRLFDAVAALCGIRNYISYEGQAAIELENAMEEEIEESYPLNRIEDNGVFLLQYKELIEGVVNDIRNKERVSNISSKFHNSLINSSCALACKIREREGINKVVLSGGVFENQYLLTKTYNCLIRNGFEVFFNEQIPINDGGISFGQVHVARAIMEKEKKG